MKSRAISYILIAVALIGVIQLLYFLVLKPMTVLAYQDQAPDWFSWTLNFLYPRFGVEKQRLGSEFFESKVLQLNLRATLAIVVFFLIFYWNRMNLPRSSRLIDFWNRTTTHSNIQIMIILFFLGVLFYTGTWYWDLKQYWLIKDFYRPILIYEVLQIPLISPAWALTLCLIMALSCLAVMINFRPIYFSIISLLVFLFLQGFFYCFEKYDHRFTTLTYAFMLMPLVIKFGSKSDNPPAWPLSLIQLMIGMVYLLAGLEKVFSSGLGWASAQTFRAYIELHQAPMGLLLASNNLVMSVLPKFALIFQFGFWLILLFPRIKIPFLIAGILFHWGSVFLFNIGDLLTPWIFIYFFFLDFNFFKQFQEGLKPSGISGHKGII